jgi:ssDNA-binding Zn-finger/Zn-ribbon topoisomerase 1
LTEKAILPILRKFTSFVRKPTLEFAFWRIPVAEKAKTAQKSDALRNKRFCPVCGGESKVVQFAGFGQQKGFFWVCDKNPEHVTRTR